MRLRLSICLLIVIATGCTASVTPRQYLDQETAATITVVARPWIFAAIEPVSAIDKRGYLSLYAFDVNRAGAHQQYFAVMQSSFDVALPNQQSAPTLEFQVNDRKMAFKSTALNPQQLGITQPLDQPLSTESRWWYFPAKREDIAAVALLLNPRVTLAAADARFVYIEFQSASKELTELAATFQ